MEKTKLPAMITFRSPGIFSHRFARTGMVCLFIWCAGSLMAAGAETNDPIVQLNKTFREARKQFLAETNSAEAAWHFSRACFDLADTAPNNTRRADYANQGIDAARQALALDNNSTPAHYYLGMNIGELADTKHNLSGLHLVKDMEREFLAAHALDEHFDFAGPDRNLGLLYEQTPVIISIGSRSKAREHLQRAVELAPDFPENQLNLIEAYLKWDYKSEAQRQLDELEKVWPNAQKKFTGAPWILSWTDWNKRFDSVKKKVEGNPKIIEPPHSNP